MIKKIIANEIETLLRYLINYELIMKLIMYDKKIDDYDFIFLFNFILNF